MRREINISPWRANIYSRPLNYIIYAQHMCLVHVFPTVYPLSFYC